MIHGNATLLRNKRERPEGRSSGCTIKEEKRDTERKKERENSKEGDKRGRKQKLEKTTTSSKWLLLFLAIFSVERITEDSAGF